MRALDSVSFGVSEGSVHALLGENGAGKSTLLKILSGAYRPDQGKMLLDGREIALRRTQDALSIGIAVIYQELQLVNQLSVAENLLLGHLPSGLGWIHRKKLREEAERLLDLVGEPISPDATIDQLPIAQRQMVEIAKALSRDAKVIAFDEPTSSLSSREVDRLFAVIRRLKEQGKVLLYISHRMDEIYEVCDAATVLRDGRHVVTHHSIANTTPEKLIRAMVGRDVRHATRYRRRLIGDPVLSVEGIEGPGVVSPLSFEIKRGEIVGVFGLVGAGRTEMARLIAGAGRITNGAVLLDGRKIALKNTKAALVRGIGLCPEDRKKEGIVPMLSIQDNLNLGVRRNFSFAGFWVLLKRERDHAEHQVRKLRIKAGNLSQPIRNLSGGNQQKVVLGRVLGNNLRVLLLDEPTRGIDVGAKAEVHEIVRDLAQHGVSVLMISSEMPELLGVCDRILVMSLGRLVGELSHVEASQERLLELALPSSQPVAEAL